ncbi:MAG: hypothetical protein Q4B31_03270 [Clostridia bacterium]|nr:hypothetical protein [Clostridia bacterium]
MWTSLPVIPPPIPGVTKAPPVIYPPVVLPTGVSVGGYSSDIPAVTPTVAEKPIATVYKEADPEPPPEGSRLRSTMRTDAVENSNASMQDAGFFSAGDL